MKFWFSVPLLLCLVSLCDLAHAQRSPAPIVNYTGVAIRPASGKALQLDEIRNAFKEAANKQQWEITETTAPDKLVAKLVMQQKHTILVDIAFDTKAYSVTYRDSINMKYSADGGQTRNQDLLRPYYPALANNSGPTIHPAYNDWVRSFVNAANLELGKL